MRSAIVLLVLLVTSNAGAQPGAASAALGRALRAGSGYAAQEPDRVVGELARIQEALRTTRATRSCRQLAERRRDALIAIVTADTSRASFVWEAARRIANSVAECPSSAVSMSDESIRAELSSWMRRQDDAAPVIPTAGTSARDLAARGRAQLDARQWDAARASFELALSGSTSDVVLAVDATIGLAQALEGARSPDARARFEEAAQRATSAGPIGRRALTDALLELGYSFARARDYPNALAQYDRALAVRRELVGAQDPWTAQLENARAVALGELRRPDEAIDANRSALAIRETALGATHPDALTSRSNIAIMLQRRGDFAGALRMQLELLPLRDRVLGTNSAQVAVTIDAIGGLEHQLRRLDQAEARYRRAVEIRERVLQVGDPDRGRSHAGLARVLADLGRMDEAMTAAEQHVALTREAHSQRHPDVVAAWTLLANIANRAGRRERAAEARAAAVSTRSP